MKKEKHIPEWFKGTVYKKGNTVTNPFSGESYKLNALELSIYDFVIGASIACELKGFDANTKIVEDLRKGLDWFKEHNAEAYMVLLD